MGGTLEVLGQSSSQPLFPPFSPLLFCSPPLLKSCFFLRSSSGGPPSAPYPIAPPHSTCSHHCCQEAADLSLRRLTVCRLPGSLAFLNCHLSALNTAEVGQTIPYAPAVAYDTRSEIVLAFSISISLNHIKRPDSPAA